MPQPGERRETCNHRGLVVWFGLGGFVGVGGEKVLVSLETRFNYVVMADLEFTIPKTLYLR